MQNVSTTKAKIDNNNVRQETHKSKRAIYIVVVNRIAMCINSYKQENLNNTI